LKKDFKCTICCAYPFNENSSWFVQQFLNDIFCVELQLSQRKIEPNWPAYAFIDENFSFQNWDNKIGMRSYWSLPSILATSLVRWGRKRCSFLSFK
jgi:hypothetical protein